MSVDFEKYRQGLFCMTDYFGIYIKKGDDVLLKSFNTGFEKAEVIGITNKNLKIKKYNKTRTIRYINPKDCINLITIEDLYPEFFL